MFVPPPQPPASTGYSLSSINAMFPLMVEHSPIGILLVGPQGRILHVNPKAQDVFGYTADELVGQTIEILVPEAARGTHVGDRDRFMEKPQARPMGAGRHLAGRHKSGRQIPVEIGLVPVKTPEGMAVLATVVDVTVQREANKVMAHLAAVVNTSEEGIITVGEDRTVVSWNRGAEKIYGYKAEEVIGRGAAMLLPPDRMEESKGLFDRVMRGESITQMETVRLRKDGHLVHVILSLTPLINERDKVTGAAAIRHDITQRKGLDEDLLHAVELEQKRIGQDLHDSLGQQLLAISFLSNILKKKLTAAGRPEASEAAHIEELLNEAKTNVRKLTRGLYAAELEARGLGACVRDLVEHTAEMSSIECSFSGDAALVLQNRAINENLYRLAQEAVNNAVRHSFAKAIHVSLTKEDSHVILSIRDNGVGLPTEGQAATGLGLRSMRYRANVIGGKLELGRHPEGGTLVRCAVTIP